MKEFKHVVITRYNWDNATKDFYGTHPDPEKWMEERYELFKATRDSVLSQKAEFDWYIAFDKKTPKSYVKKVCSSSNMIPVFKDVRNLKFNYKEPWIITTRMDNDDLYNPGALKAIQDAFTPMLQVIDIDYEQFDGDKYYTSERRGANSPFLSLVEPSDRVKTCYCRPHSKLASGYPTKEGPKKPIRASKINRPLALMVIHGNNVANQIVGREI